MINSKNKIHKGGGGRFDYYDLHKDYGLKLLYF